MRRPSPQPPLPRIFARPLLALIALTATMSGCAGCGDDKPRQSTNATGDPGSGAATITAPGSAPLTASLGGNPLALRSALLRSFGGSARLLTLSTAAMSCAELGEWREQGNENTVNLVLAPQLQSDGTSRWAITSATYEHTTRRGDLGAATLSAQSVDEPVDVALALELVTPVSTPQGTRSTQLVLDGKLRAQGCGARGTHPDVKIREQSGMQWTVAGKRFLARGATISYQPAGAILRLSTEPHSCTTSLSGSDLTATLYLDGPPPVAKRLVLAGNLLGRERTSRPNPTDFAARLDESPSGKGFAHVSVQGAGNAGGFYVVLEGVADAQVCAPNK